MEYFSDIEKYYNSIAGKLDSLQSVKDAAGQKRSLTDILDQYANAQDSYQNASEALWTYQTGINKNDIRSSDEVAADLGIDNLYDTEYYQQLKAKNDRLLQKQQDYQDKMDEIADLREELADATSKKEKKRIKQEIKTAKKEAKTLKLTSGQKKTLKSTTNTLTGAAEVSGGNAAMEETYASATYQQLLTQIGTLKNKKKLSSKDKKTLKMYEEELAAINEGVLVGNIATFRTKFEQLWKLQNKGKGLTKAEEKTKAALKKSLASISDAYADYIKQLTDEYNNALIAEGKSEADLEANYKQTREDTEKNFEDDMADLTDQSDTATVKNIEANIAKWEDWLAKGKNSKGKKLTAKEKKEYEQKILDARAKLEQLSMVSPDDVGRANDIINWLNNHRSKYEKGKLSTKEIKKWDQLTAELNGYISKQNEAVTELEKERDDALAELKNNYDTQLNELDEAKNERLARTYEYAKETAELAIKNAEAVIDMLSDQIDQYKAVVELLQDTSLENLKSYGILDFLGLSGNDATAMLRSQLTSGIQSATEKIQETVNKGNLLKKLIAAGYSGNFEDVLLANASGVDAGYIETLRTMAEQLEEDGYTHEQWIKEWKKELSKVTSELTSATKQVQEFKDELRENVLFKATDNALASVNRLKNQLSSMQSIIRDDWTTDVNGMTTYGAAKVNEYAQSWKAAQDAVGLYAQRLREIDAAQANPEEYGYASEQDWLNARNEAIQNYYTAVQEGESAAQAIYEIGKKAREQEINDLKRLVDARKDALKSKKEYYEYDKQHKAAQKSVDEIKAQVEALNNVSDAASKAKKQQLLSDLKDAEDALQDLETEHRFDLSDKALDDFINDLEDTLNNANATIKDTFEEFTKIVEETIEAAKGVNTQWESDRLVSYFGLGDKTKILSDSSMVNPTSLIGENGSIYTPITAEEFTSGLSTIKVDLTAVETYLSRINNDAEKMVATLATMSPDLRTIVEGLDYSLDLSMNWENLVNVEGSLDAVSTERLMKEMATIPSMITQKIYQMISKAGLKKKYR